MRVHSRTTFQSGTTLALAFVFAAGVSLEPMRRLRGPTALSPPPGNLGSKKPKAADNRPKHVPDSSLSFTEAKINDPFGPADWYPGDHPKMPDIVAHGRKPEICACSLCHYPNGKGRPENAGVAGLPVSYFIQQMQDFGNGLGKAPIRKRKTQTS